MVPLTLDCLFGVMTSLSPDNEMAKVLPPAGAVELPAPPAKTYLALALSVTCLGKADPGIFFQITDQFFYGFEVGY